MPDDAVTWLSTDGSDEWRDLFYKAAIARITASEKAASDNRFQGLIFGIGGLGIAAIAVITAMVVHIKTPMPNLSDYMLVDSSTGEVSRPFASSKDAPREFPESVRRRALRDFIVACESYVPQTWDKLGWHDCMIHATPDEQKRRAADIGPDGPRYPRLIFGPAGWAEPTAFPAFVKLGESGSVTSKTYHYQVRYERTEVSNGHETRPHWTADVTFQFHPELKISADDRLLNESLFQAISFSTVRD